VAIDKSLAKTYKITSTCSSGTSSALATFALTLTYTVPPQQFEIAPNTGPSEFSPPLTHLALDLGKTLAFKFPSLTDPDSTDTPSVVSLSVNDSAVISGKYPNLFIKSTKAGTFTVSISVKDSNRAGPLSA
jgi:hypothetical protein